ncbi:serine hydrolase domain-containing protein [Larkinella rosea]|uniref:Class A beta-lactamase-related serine hydrolase n=1 Tax=Larkinella rosea TaxID=2025312 RepID=A0A3P1BAR8_9BACT|nr:serine hydrolase domain-containing protein [Larkinella rosea]RRA98114.1 class A beta-lactamase-related serine hydrolase [Larkinella rosea]
MASRLFQPLFYFASTLWGVFFMLSPVICAQDNPSYEDRIDSLYAHLNQTTSPGIALAVVRDGKIILSKGYGMADLEHGVKMTPATVFDLASLAKQFTGLLICKLATEGKIRLQDDIRAYIPELNDFGKTITIEHLLQHSSGIRDWYGSFYIAGGRTDDPITFNQILNFAYRQKSLNNAPGTKYLYSNTGYNLLAELIQRVTGKSFRKWANEQIFDPLDMTSTLVQDNYSELISNRAFGYVKGANGSWYKPVNALTGLGSSSVFSNVEDMAKWLINFGSARVAGSQALTLMKTPGRLNDGTINRYSSGITSGSYHDLPMFTSAGSWAGFSTFDVFFPEQKFGVVVLTNSTFFNAQTAAIQITDIFLANQFKPQPQSGMAVDSEQSNKAPVALEMDAFTGVFKQGKSNYLRIEKDGNILTAWLPNLGKVSAVRVSANRFRVEDEEDGSELLFQPEKVMTVKYKGQQFTRLDTNEPVMAGLKDYAGDYYSKELGTTYQVIVKNDKLELVTPKRPNLQLSPVWPGGFTAQNPFINLCSFERDTKGIVCGLLLNGDPRSSNYRFKKIASKA